MADSQDPSGQHAEGIQHISANTAPPGTQDTSRGTEGGVGTGAESTGVSSSQDFKSPLVPNSSSQGGVIDTVKSYLGYGNEAGSGAGETGQLGSSGEARNTTDTTSSTTGSGSGSGITGAAASAASAVGLSSGNSAAGGGLGSTSSTSGAGDNTTGSDSSNTAGGSTLEAAKEKAQEVTNTSDKTDKNVTSGDDDHKPPQPASGQPRKLENESAIPTAGGERLGEKHWGESKIVPDNPEKRASEAGVSSEEGQPTKQTSDNTAKNTGGATGPPGSSSAGDSSGNGDDKPGAMDKIKDKLHIGKKE